MGSSDPTTGTWIRNDGSNMVVSTNSGDVFLGYNVSASPNVKLGNNGDTCYFSGTAPNNSLGLGTNNPVYNLDVSGSTRVTGNSTVDGSLSIPAQGAFSNTSSALDLYSTTGTYRIGFDNGGGVGYIRYNIAANSATNTWALF